MTIRDELEQQQEHWTPAIRAAYEDLVRRLGQAETAQRALKVGDRLPPFVLPNAEGGLISSDELLAQGPLVIIFFRGEWCPFCRVMLRAMSAAAPAIAAAGGRMVALSPETGGRLLQTKRRMKLELELLADVDSGVALAFGVAFRAPDQYRQMLESYGTDLGERTGNVGWIIPIPAAYVADRAGVIRYAFVERDFVRRAEPAEIVAMVREIVQAT